MKTYATYNIKGGVGKTTAAVNLAYLSAADSCRTLLWDLDPQGAASFLFRVKPRVKGGGKALIRGTKALDDAIKGTDFENLDLLPADFTYRNMDLLLDAAHKDPAEKKPTRKLAQLLRTPGNKVNWRSINRRGRKITQIQARAQGPVTSSQQSHLAKLRHTEPGVHETRDAPHSIAPASRTNTAKARQRAATTPETPAQRSSVRRGGHAPDASAPSA